MANKKQLYYRLSSIIVLDNNSSYAAHYFRYIIDSEMQLWYLNGILSTKVKNLDFLYHPTILCGSLFYFYESITEKEAENWRKKESKLERKEIVFLFLFLFYVFLMFLFLFFK